MIYIPIWILNICKIEICILNIDIYSIYSQYYTLDIDTYIFRQNIYELLNIYGHNF